MPLRRRGMQARRQPARRKLSAAEQILLTTRGEARVSQNCQPGISTLGERGLHSECNIADCFAILRSLLSMEPIHLVEGIIFLEVFCEKIRNV